MKQHKNRNAILSACLAEDQQPVQNTLNCWIVLLLCHSACTTCCPYLHWYLPYLQMEITLTRLYII